MQSTTVKFEIAHGNSTTQRKTEELANNLTNPNPEMIETNNNNTQNNLGQVPSHQQAQQL
jgi:hypothetical protein